jgi:hypothetical protein
MYRGDPPLVKRMKREANSASEAEVEVKNSVYVNIRF